ncbi:5'-nucleotidase/2',3'-cyclic phosphodiesterase and related esterases [Candidatus Scalindua japonica]|uniref:5'-nucleotidase/2',3'-cyclic phosphodiesterase and related esterases n=1 Tax=Candidatus Scalindua japonica TaxID=1284222 RepID=A0A286TXD0_9BACT|nr:multiheme c-type cytochrome [Candidatus Scalindua japonica]GAX60536.1 5'-nucleotidase/2',3'-cyclic phosphodiesterase and related esterases [Candidatus Scalindua japonica]
MIRNFSKIPVLIIIVFVFMFLALSNQGCNDHYGNETGKDPDKTLSLPVIHIVFTGEENGYLEPCGCSEGQLGGFAKRQTLINQLRKKDQDLILLSMGDLPGKVGRQEEIKMETALEALGLMDYVAHNIGEKDLNMGIDFLGYLSQISNIEFISSNITGLATRALNIKPYVVKEIKTNETIFKVGILGIVSPALIENEIQDLEVMDPVLSLKPLLSDLNDKTDLLILLSHAEMAESVKIAEEYPELELIISGHMVDRPDLYHQKVNNTYIASVGEKGKYVGNISISLQPKQTSEDNNSFSTAIETIALDEKFADSSDIAMLLGIYQQRLQDEELLAQVFKSDHPSNLSFTGNDDCALCHNSIFKHWEETGHASAYETLVNAEHEYDPECVACHVIGLNYFSGFETTELTPEMKGVGCESCHGPGSDHKDTQSQDYGMVSVENCEICHNPEHSPKFEYKEYWQKIKHPREEKQGGD